MADHISLSKTFLKWEWYTDKVVTLVFLHLLLKANSEDVLWKGMKVSKGSFVTTYQELMIELKYSKSRIRRAIDSLVMTEYIDVESTYQYTLITINNYDDFINNPLNQNYLQEKK